MTNLSEWSQPKNTYVEVAGDDVQVPEIDDFTLTAILNGGDEQLGNMHEALRYLKSLKDKEVEAGYQFYTDRWTWDSGHPIDKFFSRVFEAEHKRRKELMNMLDHVWKKEPLKSRVMEILDMMAAERERSSLIPSSPSPVNTLVLPETTDDTNSQPSKSVHPGLHRDDDGPGTCD